MLAEALDWAAPALEGITLEGLRRTGWARLNLPPADSFAPHAEGNFPTPSGKCEFVASGAAGGNFVLPLFRQGSSEFQPGQPVPALPTFATPDPSTQRYPLRCISPKSHAFLNSGYANLARQRHAEGEPRLLMHPDDADRRGIEDGDPVSVFNDRGSFPVVARVSDDVRPGVVTTGLGHWRKLSRGATLAAVTSAEFGDLGNCPTFSDTLVEVRPATPGS
jgi:anaerobic selenocysteine-containing dehydrogenase